MTIPEVRGILPIIQIFRLEQNRRDTLSDAEFAPDSRIREFYSLMAGVEHFTACHTLHPSYYLRVSDKGTVVFSKLKYLLIDSEHALWMEEDWRELCEPVESRDKSGHRLASLSVFQLQINRRCDAVSFYERAIAAVDTLVLI